MPTSPKSSLQLCRTCSGAPDRRVEVTQGVKQKLSLAAANLKDSKANLNLIRPAETSTAVNGPPSPNVFTPARFLSFPPTFPEEISTHAGFGHRDCI